MAYQAPSRDVFLDPCGKEHKRNDEHLSDPSKAATAPRRISIHAVGVRKSTDVGTDTGLAWESAVSCMKL